MNKQENTYSRIFQIDAVIYSQFNPLMYSHAMQCSGFDTEMYSLSDSFSGILCAVS